MYLLARRKVAKEVQATNFTSASCYGRQHQLLDAVDPSFSPYSILYTYIVTSYTEYMHKKHTLILRQTHFQS